MVTVNPTPIANAGNDVSTCRGTSVTLTASGGDTYLWETGATTASITVNPGNTRTYTVEVTQNGCTATDDVTVTVNPLPSIDAGANVTINLGESVTLTATGGNSYQWSTGETTPSITVSPVSTTSYTVIGTNDNGCSRSDIVSVTVLTGNDVTADAGADVSICEGSSTTLSATGGSTYEWSTGETTASITVSPDATTTYTVTAFDATGTNSDTDEVTVSVNAAPVLYVSPDFTINSGQIVILYAFGANSYSWSTGQTGHFVLLFPTETTTYTVTGTNTNGCQTTASVTITVANGSSFPGNAGFDKTTCSGYGVTLTANGGDTYLWSTGETTQSINVNPNSTTTYSVVAYTSAAEITDEVTVHVNPNPVVHITNGEDVTILQGEYVTLSATGANRYEWNNGATLANIAVNPDETTTFSVTGYIQDCSDTKDITVNVVPQVVAFAGDNQSICLNESVTLTASGGDEFLWNTGETTPSITVSPSETTEYSVTVYNDLDYDTAEVLVTVQDCSVTDETPEDAEPFEFLVYPNPTSGSLNVKISGKLKVSNITLYDLSGKAIYHEVITDTEQLGFEKTLDLSNYSDGLYLLKLVDNGYAITKKIVVHR
ncbi:MAG: T9SS type A sorting domain-containing protein [Gelidibacter sp.]